MLQNQKQLSSPAVDHTIHLPIATIAKVLIFVVVLLLLGSLAMPLVSRSFGLDQANIPPLFQLSDSLFAVNDESNIPTWFSSALLLLSALLLAIIARYHVQKRDRYARHWVMLSVIFFYLSADETGKLHEKMAGLTRMVYQPQVLYPWIFAGAVIVFVVGILYLGFLRALPAKTRSLFILSGFLYVGGALGLEIAASIANHQLGPYYNNSAIRLLLTHTEELMEFTGVIVFLYTLLYYINTYIGSIRIVFSSTSKN